jgi:hypothetical protein
VLGALIVPALAQTTPPPAIRFSTNEAFAAAAIPAYAGQHDEVYRHIDANIANHVQRPVTSSQ